jgi:hypothetical protein
MKTKSKSKILISKTPVPPPFSVFENGGGWEGDIVLKS